VRAAILWMALGCGSSHSGTSDGPPGGGDGRGVDACCDGGTGSADAAVDAPAGCVSTPNCPSGQWCAETAPIASSVTLISVWAIDSNDVLAVGNSGTILYRHCNSWSALTSGTTQNLTGVWASAIGDAWAVGDAGTLVHFNGTSWSATTGMTDNFTAVWGSATNDVWAVSASGAAYHYNGSTWTASSPGPGGTLLSISGTGTSDVWVAGETSRVHHYTGSSWGSAIDPATAGDYFAVLARSTTNVWITSAISGKETLQYNGSMWTPHTTGSNIIQALWARADADMFGTAGKKIAHWDGGGWTTTTPTVNQPLWGVTGTATDVFVVGSAATILHQD
jgi:hypothetical protein